MLALEDLRLISDLSLMISDLTSDLLWQTRNWTRTCLKLFETSVLRLVENMILQQLWDSSPPLSFPSFLPVSLCVEHQEKALLGQQLSHSAVLAAWVDCQPPPLSSAQWMSALNCVLMFLQTYNWAPFSAAKTDICQFICIRALFFPSPSHPPPLSLSDVPLPVLTLPLHSVTSIQHEDMSGHESPLLRGVSHVITIIYKTHSGSVA